MPWGAYLKTSEIKRRIREREKDYVMPVYFPFLPAILSIIMMPIIGVSLFLGGEFFGFLVTGIVLAVVLGIVVLVLGIYVFYKWIDRRNKHFKRVRLFYENVLDFLEEKGMEKETRKVRRTLREMEGERDEKSPILWIILSIIFNPVIFYVLHFLTRDFYEHEKRENFVLEDIEELVQEAGGDFEFEGYKTIGNRNTILYLILTINNYGDFWVILDLCDYQGSK